MRARDLMTADPFCVTPSDPVCKAAELMRYEKIGGVPVVADEKTRTLVGIITDRDITIRCVARRHPSTCAVNEAMTPAPLRTVGPDDDVHEIVRLMEAAEVRRIPVVGADDRLLGIVAEADLAAKLPSEEAMPLRKRVKRVGAGHHVTAVT
jgi:CBS domain-containing protein